MVAPPADVRSGPDPHLVRRAVGYRLPRGSLVVDVAWHPGAALAYFADDYPTIAITPDTPRPDAVAVAVAVAVAGRAVAGPTILADDGRLPVAGESVDCVLVLHPVGGPVGGPDTLPEALRILRPGGLVVVAATLPGTRVGGRDVGSPRPREAVALVIRAMTDLGLAPEQVTHLEPLWRPMSLLSRLQVRARSGRAVAPAEQAGLPLACRVVAAVNQLDLPRAGRPRRPWVSSVLVFARKP